MWIGFDEDGFGNDGPLIIVALALWSYDVVTADVSLAAANVDIMLFFGEDEPVVCVTLLL